jgi:anaerobic magnesium-protoporphyrin IX monomethyl ester cyclase
VRILLVNPDNGNSAAEAWFPQALAYIRAGLNKQNVSVDILDLNIIHSNDALRRWLGISQWDIVCLSVIGGYWQYKQFKEVMGIINKCNRREKMYVLCGGHLFSHPEYFIQKFGVDCVFRGDGEDLGTVIREQPRGVWQGKTLDIDALPWPAYDKFDLLSHYRLLRMPNCVSTDYCLPVLSSRGCPYHCNFCYRLDSNVRLRHVDAVVGEIKYLQDRHGITYVAFADELLMMSPGRAIELSEALMPLKIKWDCNGRLNYAQPEVLETMKRAGCVFINYGIEAFDDTVLKNMNKHLTCWQIEKGVEATLAAGISPGLNLLWGNIGDTPETLNKAVEFLLKYDDHAQRRTIRPVTPYPGTDLFDYCVEKGLIDDVEDFYERKHSNSDLFTADIMGLGLEEAHHLLYAANEKLLMNYAKNNEHNIRKQLYRLYYEKDASFRGFRAR